MSFPRYPAYKKSGVEWVGEIPVGWEYCRLRFVAQFNPSKTEISYIPLNEEVSFLPMEAIGDDGTINLGQKRKISDVQNGYTYFRDMDVIFAKITPCFENGKGALAQGLLRGIGFGTTELIVARSAPSRVIPEYLLRFFQSDIFRKPAEASMYGAGGQKRVSESFVRDFSIPLPPLPEQQAIASFLDRECGKIDALIAEQERLIALLAEKRQAVISHAVTKGLNLNAPMKDSGIPWIGMVPEGWEVVRLSLVSDHISSGTTPDTNNENFYDGDICWVTTGELREAAIKNTTKKVTKLALEKFSALQIYPPGTLLLAMYGATVGRIAWLETHATTNQACCALVFSKKIKMKFVFYTMLAAKESLLLLSSGGGQPNINQEKVRSFRIPVPSLSEQSKIIDFLDSNMKDLDSLSGKIEKTLLLFKERRSALISAAVTGKIDVRAQSKAIAA